MLKYLTLQTPTHPPIKHILCHFVTRHILWGTNGVGGGGVVGGFMGWVDVWWWGGWFESSWVSKYMHPPHPKVLGVMGGWVWAGGHGHDGQVGVGVMDGWV